ncbi:hypothetical protein GC106_83480 [Kibdelosporangium sp. 4NS15]|uniref:Short chain dehydrogenase n=1 Tax=Kibdelosporangium persicum TaxID=2698649 RepID=A0ABX2FIK3_9PSEU|nr:SDR family NAD(P)-dependent oxidoreductase [Kibdelosporangium persicum]NRN71073.1 hypothetical protein [Kibdelosporangium persicum]
MTRFRSQTALVTGGTGGQGASHVRAFHAEGANVVIGDIDADRGAALAEELGDRAHFTKLDVTDETSWFHHGVGVRHRRRSSARSRSSERARVSTRKPCRIERLPTRRVVVAPARTHPAGYRDHPAAGTRERIIDITTRGRRTGRPRRI